MTPPRSRRVHAFEGVAEVRHQRSKRRIERRAAGDQYVVIVGARLIGQNVAYRGLEAPPDAIALHSPSDLLADGEAEPSPFRQSAAPPRLQDEGGRCPSRAGPNAKELGSPPECRQPGDTLPLATGHGATTASLTPTAACAPWHAGATGSSDRRPSPCACETRGGACERASRVGMYVSWQTLLFLVFLMNFGAVLTCKGRLVNFSCDLRTRPPLYGADSLYFRHLPCYDTGL